MLRTGISTPADKNMYAEKAKMERQIPQARPRHLAVQALVFLMTNKDGSLRMCIKPRTTQDDSQE